MAEKKDSAQRVDAKKFTHTVEAPKNRVGVAAAPVKPAVPETKPKP